MLVSALIFCACERGSVVYVGEAEPPSTSSTTASSAGAREPLPVAPSADATLAPPSLPTADAGRAAVSPQGQGEEGEEDHGEEAEEGDHREQDAAVATESATEVTLADSGAPLPSEQAAGPDAGNAGACAMLNCGGAQPYCESAGLRCVECVEDAHCGGDLPRCFSNNTCVECLVDEDCPETGRCVFWEGHCIRF